MIKGDITPFKQVLVDIDNYSALKDLGKTGDLFNNVIRDLLIKAKKDSQNLTQKNWSNDLKINSQ
jgi:hypothetical protein